MKTFILVVIVFIGFSLCLALIGYTAYIIDQYVKFTHLKSDGFVWTYSDEQTISYNETCHLVSPVKIVNVDENKNGKTTYIYLETNERFSFREFRKSHYSI